MARSNKNLDSVVQELKAGLLHKDARIEELEIACRRLLAENRQLRAQTEALRNGEAALPGAADKGLGSGDIDASPISPAAPASGSAVPHWPRLPLRGEEKAAQLSRAFGYHADKWSGPELHAEFRALGRIRSGTLGIWTSPGERDHISIALHVNNNCVGAFSVPARRTTKFAFEADIPEGETFTIKVVSDYSAPGAPPDMRLLSFVLTELEFL